MPYRKELRRGYPWRGENVSGQALDQIADAGSRRFRTLPPLKMRQDRGLIEFSLEDPHRFEWFSLASHAQVREYIEPTFEDSAPLISKMLAGDCQGAMIPEGWYSAWAFPLQFLGCEKQDAIDYGKPTRLYFPAMSAPIRTCSPVRAVFNYDSGFWESDYRGPKHLAVMASYTTGQQGPSQADVYCLNNVGQMVDSGIDIELYFDWTPPAADHTGNFSAEWHDCDCRWRATCCQGEPQIIEFGSCGESTIVTRNPTTGEFVNFSETSASSPMNLSMVNQQTPSPSRNIGVVSIVFTDPPPAALNFSMLERALIGGIFGSVPVGANGTLSLYDRGGDVGTGLEMWALEHALGGPLLNPYVPAILSTANFITPMTNTPGTVSIFPEVELLYQTWLASPVMGTWAELEGGFNCVRDDSPPLTQYWIFEFAIEITDNVDNTVFSLTDMVWTGV